MSDAQLVVMLNSIILVRLIELAAALVLGSILVAVSLRDRQVLIARGLTRLQWLISSGQVGFFYKLILVFVLMICVGFVALLMPWDIWQRIVGVSIQCVVAGVLCWAMVASLFNRRAMLRAIADGTANDVITAPPSPPFARIVRGVCTLAVMVALAAWSLQTVWGWLRAAWAWSR